MRDRIEEIVALDLDPIGHAVRFSHCRVDDGRCVVNRSTRLPASAESTSGELNQSRGGTRPGHSEQIVVLDRIPRRVGIDNSL